MRKRPNAVPASVILGHAVPARYMQKPLARVATKHVPETRYQYGQPDSLMSLLVTMSLVTQMPLAIISRIPHISVEMAILAELDTKTSEPKTLFGAMKSPLRELRELVFLN